MIGLLLLLLSVVAFMFIDKTSGQGIIKCPGVCEYFPCGCCEDNLLSNCNEGNCHSNGCNQCNNGKNLFKRDYTYYCETCQDIFGDACLFCGDTTGCQQCEGETHDRVQDPITEMYYCQPKSGTATVLDCGVNHKIEYNVTSFPDHDPDPSCVSSPTFYPTEPTSNPTDRPTDSPTERPSSSPTERPSFSPTDRPTPRPTGLPTVKPTYRSCDYNFSQSINIVFSNGCNLESDTCDEIKTFLRNIVESTYNSDKIDSYKIYSHNKNDGIDVIGDGLNRDELLSSIDNNIECGSNPQNTDFDSAISNGMIDLRDNGSGSDERRLLILSFCDVQDSENDDTCNAISNVDPDGDADIEIFVFNSDTLSNDQFSCLLPQGSSDNNLFYAPSQDGELLNSYFLPLITNEICSRNTPSPTSSPTPNPTPLPTPNPTKAPTEKVITTEEPSESPSESPTEKPTSSPTNSYCDLGEETKYLAVMVSNGCSMSDDECTSMKSYLIEIIEKVYDPDRMNPLLFTHYLDGVGQGELIFTRDDISPMVNLLECGSSSDNDSVIYDDFFAVILNFTKIIGDVEEWTILMINLCLPEDGSDICDVQSTHDRNGEVKVIVVNVGSDLVASDDFACLVDGGTSGENYNEYNNFNEALVDSNINHVRDEICESRTPSPTPNPTNQPTEKPRTPSPTVEPTPIPTPDPTPGPTPNPTPYPSASPTDSEVLPCDYDFDSGVVITVSTGCSLSDYDCESLRNYLKQIILESYNDDNADMTILLHGYDDNSHTRSLIGTRSELLDAINDDTQFSCNSIDNDDNTDYEGTLEAALDQLVDNDLYDEKKVVIISLCNAPYDDNTCNVVNEYDPDNEVEITIVNLGSDVSNNDQFKCLIDDDNEYEDNNYYENDSDDLNKANVSDIIYELCEERVEKPCIKILECPSPCTNDPCDCIYEEVRDCIMSACHPNGCDQCENGYFKKDYNYPCVSCKDTFGDDCMHCTDFLGCQQCSTGIRTYDPDCGLYYCDDGECDNTIGDDDDDDDYSDSSDSSDSGTVMNNTRSSTWVPVESDTETTGSSYSKTTRVVRVCADGYFEIVSVSRPDYQFLLGKYYENSETSISGYPKFELDSDEYNVIGYVSNDGDYVFEYIDNYGDTYYFMLDGTINDLCDLSGTNNYEITGEGEGSTDIEIIAYTCDDEIYECECENDCIDVSGFMIDDSVKINNMDTLFIGGSDAINGYYCYDTDSKCQSSGSSCYINDNEYGYTVELALFTETNPDTYDDDDDENSYYYLYFNYVEIASPDKKYEIYYQYDFGSNTDFACQEIIDEYFRNGELNNAQFYLIDHVLETRGFVNSTIPNVTFDDCVGKDFYCGLASSAHKNYYHYYNMNNVLLIGIGIVCIIEMMI